MIAIITILFLTMLVPAFAMSNGGAGGGDGTTPGAGRTLPFTEEGGFTPTESAGDGAVTTEARLSAADPDNPQHNVVPPIVETPRVLTSDELRDLTPAPGALLLTGRAKPLVRYDTIYHFQNFDQLYDNPSINGDYQLRHNDYIGDFMRRLTFRLWYGYGWASPRWGTPDSNRPMFGYFPVTDEELRASQIESDMRTYYDNFSNNALAFSNRSVNIYDHNYFNFMSPRPVPLIYISDFGPEESMLPRIQEIACEIDFGPRPGLPAGDDEDERLITPQPGTFDLDEEVAEAEAALEEIRAVFGDPPVPDIEIRNWRKSRVTIKKFNHVLLEPRLADSDIDFSTMVRRVVIPFLEQKETYTISDNAPQGQECSIKETTVIPKRYYDYNFQLLLADEQVSGQSNYNGSFSLLYERTTDRLPLILEPLFPNIYVIDFANTTIEEYYKLLSLNNTISEFPANSTPEFINMVENFRYSETDAYLRRWSNGIVEGVERSRAVLNTLAIEYRKLIFSNLYRERYRVESERFRRNSQMNATIDFNIEFDNRILNPIFQEVAESATAYDPVVHLISDTQLIDSKVPNELPFAGPILNGPLGSEFMRDVTNSNGDTSPSVVAKPTDFTYEVNNVWNIQEWFRLYCIPEIVNSEEEWDCFFRVFPEQYPMLYHDPETWIWDPDARKPVPVGAEPGAEFGIPLTGETTSIPPIILQTPDGDRWGECTGIESFINPLSDLYSKLNDKIEKFGFRTYREVMDGKLAYSEPLFYRLEKTPKVDLPEGVAGIINEGKQSFFLPANLIEEGFSYVDAQIHYGQEYDYTLHGYYLVIGNEYWYAKTEDVPLQRPDQSKRVTWSDLTQEELDRFANNRYPREPQLDSIRDAARATGVTIEGLFLYALVQETETFNSIRELAVRVGIEEERLRALIQIARNKVLRIYQIEINRNDQETVLQQIIEIILGGAGIDQASLLALIIEDLNRVLAEASAARAESGTSTIPGSFLKDYTFTVHNRPHVVLVETNVFSPDFGAITTKTVDDPPLPPDIDIIPYRSVKDKALHMLNGSIGKYSDKPKIIADQDVQIFKDIILSQGMEQPFLGGRVATPGDITPQNIEQFDINFNSDDYPELFEIYRVDFEPRSYRDFDSRLGKKVTLDNTSRLQGDGVSEEPNWRDTLIVTSNSFVDEIIPNKKYWYTFRVVDIHGNVSNPSGVLQFEMVDTGNSIFPLIQEYTFPEPEITYIKPMRKYLKISPSDIHTQIDAEVTDATDFRDNHPRLGTGLENSVWKKNYKLRLTSRLTGKKIDINFTFKQSDVNDDKLLALDDVESG